MAWTTARRLDRTTFSGPTANFEFKIMSSSNLGEKSRTRGCWSASWTTNRGVPASLSLISLPRLDISSVLFGIRHSRYPEIVSNVQHQRESPTLRHEAPVGLLDNVPICFKVEHGGQQLRSSYLDRVRVNVRPH
jgi:hypothetical protein